jgi:pimeloyl-[acyl-carrier protein] methyl ester esterase
MSSRNLVFLHGWGTDSSAWKHQADYFSKKHNIETPDIMSCPRKRASKNDFDLDSRFRGNDSSAAVLVGWSYGGMVAMDYAAKNPSRVRALVLTGCSPKFTDGMSIAVIRNIKRNLGRDFKKTMEDCYSTFFSDKEADFKKRFISEQILPDKDIAMRILHELLTLDQRYILGGIKIPTLIVHGDKDTVCPLAGARSLHEGIKDSGIFILKDAGHMPFYTRPEEFNKIVEEFIGTLD